MNFDLYIFLYTVTVTGIAYTLPVSLYPNLAIEKGYSESYVGFIFSIYCIGNLLTIPFTNNLIAYFKRYNLLVISFILKVRI